MLLQNKDFNLIDNLTDTLNSLYIKYYSISKDKVKVLSDIFY